jgi:hypothetical protein
MAEQFIVTYRDKKEKPLFAVTWNPYDFNTFRLAGRKNEDEIDGIFWEAFFSFPCFDLGDYPEIDYLVGEIYEALRAEKGVDELLNCLGSAVKREEELRKKYIPDFLIKNNEIDWSRINRITRSADLPRIWNKLILRLEAELPRPMVISSENHEYIFNNCCSILDEYVASDDLVLNSLPNTCKLVFNEVGVENHDILLDMYCKTDAYYAVCTPDGLIHAYAICDLRKNVKALCLV